MILLTHPFGNANVRAVLQALWSAGLLEKFVTTLGWSKDSYPYLSDHIRGKLRRNYALPVDKIDIHPLRESIRLIAMALRWRGLTRHETGWASIDQVWASLDRKVAGSLHKRAYGANLSGVYAYEDCAWATFSTAQDLGLQRIYDLPIAYWETTRRLLQEEGQRYPDWEPTLGATRDSAEKLARKTQELELAELIICPSQFVRDSLPEEAQRGKRCIVAPFGSPVVETSGAVGKRSVNDPVRFLFVGALSQRKGLADLFLAMKLIGSNQVALVVMGQLLRPLNWYRQYANFVYEAPRPHNEVLRLMQTCDVLVLPSIVEGRALVQQEAMACGLPVIATQNAGADDLIVDGETGFLAPIRSPEKIAERMSWFVSNRERISGMGIAAQSRARELTWPAYGEKIVAAIRDLTQQ
jgi:glycosyltransferase involved in cell wall biosynthesis